MVPRRWNLGRRRLLAGAGALLGAPAIVRAQGINGVALVIGNARYQWEARLPNVRRDAGDVARRFGQLGLRTELVEDVAHDALKGALDRFSRTARGSDFAALYFAGHGAHWERSTYIVPVDADANQPDVVRSLPSAATIFDGLRETSHRLFVIDSGRDNPAGDWRQDWAQRQAGKQRGRDPRFANTLLLYSTAPGRSALDGPAGQNSPFAAAFLRQLATPPVDLRALPGRLRRDLLVATDGRQFLWDENDYNGPFLLAGPGGSGGSRSLPAAGVDPPWVVELPNAYAFAGNNDFFMPPGLVACRPRGPSGDAARVGAYRLAGAGNRGVILLVLSVEDPQAVDLLLAGRFNNHAFWRFATGRLSGDTLEWSGMNRVTLRWKDANAGSFAQTVIAPNAPRNGMTYSGTFTRLDG